MSGGQFDWGGRLKKGRPGGNVRGKSGCMLGSPFSNLALLR